MNANMHSMCNAHSHASLFMGLRRAWDCVHMYIDITSVYARTIQYGVGREGISHNYIVAQSAPLIRSRQHIRPALTSQ